MATSANVTATLIIKGQDQASAQIDKSAKAAKGLTGQLQAAQAQAQGLTASLRSAVSGDLLGGARAMSGAFGGGGGLAGAAATAAAGVAGVAVAIGAAAIKVTEWSIELERLRAQMQFAFAGGEQQALATAQAIGGVAVEAVTKLQATLKTSGAEGKVTVAQLQAITNAATAMGKTGDDALTAFADALRTGSTEALKGIGVAINGEKAIKDYATSVGKTTDQLSAAERSQAVLNAVLAEVPNLSAAGTTAYSRQDAALAALANSTVAFKLQLSELVAGPMVKIVENLNDMTGGTDRLGAAIQVVIKQALTPLRAILSGVERATRAVALVQRGDLVEAAAAAGEALVKLNPLTGAIAQTVDDWSGRSLEAVQAQFAVKASAEVAGAALESQSGKVGGLATAFDLFGAAAVKAATAQAKFAGEAKRAADQRAAQARAAAAQRAQAASALKVRQNQDFETGLAADIEAAAARRREIARDEAKSAQDAAAAYQALQDRVLGVYATVETDPARKALLEQQQIEIDKTRELAAVKANLYLTEAQQAQLSAAIQVEAANRVAESQRRVREATMQQIGAWAVAGDAIAGSLLTGDAAIRASAGLKALMAGAESFYQFSLGNIPGSIAAGAAAVGYAKAALAPTPQTATGGAAAVPARSIEPAQPSSNGGGGMTIILNGIMTTKAEVGAAVSKAINAAKPTGMLPA